LFTGFFHFYRIIISNAEPKGENVIKLNWNVANAIWKKTARMKCSSWIIQLRVMLSGSSTQTVFKQYFTHNFRSLVRWCKAPSWMLFKGLAFNSRDTMLIGMLFLPIVLIRLYEIDLLGEKINMKMIDSLHETRAVINIYSSCTLDKFLNPDGSCDKMLSSKSLQ
jgi:hypothetical protein